MLADANNVAFEVALNAAPTSSAFDVVRAASVIEKGTYTPKLPETVSSITWKV